MCVQGTSNHSCELELKDKFITHKFVTHSFNELFEALSLQRFHGPSKCRLCEIQRDFQLSPSTQGALLPLSHKMQTNQADDHARNRGLCLGPAVEIIPLLCAGGLCHPTRPAGEAGPCPSRLPGTCTPCTSTGSLGPPTPAVHFSGQALAPSRQHTLRPLEPWPPTHGPQVLPVGFSMLHSPLHCASPLCHILHSISTHEFAQILL